MLVHAEVPISIDTPMIRVKSSSRTQVSVDIVKLAFCLALDTTLDHRAVPEGKDLNPYKRHIGILLRITGHH